MRPDRHFVLAHQNQVGAIGRAVDEMMPAEVPTDNTNAILWGEIGISFDDVVDRIKEIAGIHVSARLYEYGMNRRGQKIRPAGFCLKGYLDSAADHIPLWTVPETDVTKNNLVQLAWIIDQGLRERSMFMSGGQVKGPIYASGIVRRIHERLYDPLPMRMMLERSKRTRETYEFSTGNYPRTIDGAFTMNLNYVSASVKTNPKNTSIPRLTYAGNMVTAAISLPESAAMGLVGRAIEEVIDWDLMRGSGLTITSARRLPHEDFWRLGVSNPTDIEILEKDPEEEE